jgi:uncharacterized membrane protein
METLMDGSAQTSEDGVSKIEEEMRGGVGGARSIRQVFTRWIIEASIVGILISVLAAVCFYRIPFPGPLSTSPDDWAAFGSYIGGVFGPLVSFVTLLAVLKTVYLQRELLDTQRREMSEMANSQRHSIKLQRLQLADAEEQNRRARIIAYKEVQLRLIDQLISYLQRTQDGKIAAAMKVMDSGLSNEIKLEKVAPLIKDKDELQKQIGKLIFASVEISTEEYESVDELKIEVMKRIYEATGGSAEHGLDGSNS